MGHVTKQQAITVEAEQLWGMSNNRSPFWKDLIGLCTGAICCISRYLQVQVVGCARNSLRCDALLQTEQGNFFEIFTPPNVTILAQNYYCLIATVTITKRNGTERRTLSEHLQSVPSYL